jgi:hypothetical protein
MKRPRPKLHLVGQDTAEIFDDLGKLRSDLAAPPLRRPRAVETFARIPHDKGLALCRHRLGFAAWAVLIELDRLILKHRGRNPVRLESSRLRGAGINYQTRARALRQLAGVGVLQVERRGLGLAPWVTHLWYPRQD